MTRKAVLRPRNNATLVSHTEEPTFVALQNRRSTNRNRKDRSEISSETNRSLGSVESRRFRSSRDVRVVRNCRSFKTAPNRKKNICSFVCVLCACANVFSDLNIALFPAPFRNQLRALESAL